MGGGGGRGKNLINFERSEKKETILQLDVGIEKGKRILHITENKSLVMSLVKF